MMGTTSSRCALALLLAALPSSSTASPRAELVVVLADGAAGPELARATREVTWALRRGGATALAPEEAQGELARDADLRAHRQQAETALAQAVALVANVRYDEALIRLASAEREAQAALAALVAPRLLAEICLQRGLALLATDGAAAQRWFAQSAQHWPGREFDPADHAPPILQRLREAEGAARASPLERRLRASDAARLARALRASALLTLSARVTRGRVRLSVRRYDAARGAWTAGSRLEWRAGASDDEVREVLRPLAGPLPPLSGDAHASTGGGVRRAVGWVLVGVSAATLAAGVGLTLHALGRIDQARSLANRLQPVEYGGQVSDLEDQAARSRAGAIVCYSTAAASAVAALVLLLRREAPPATRTRSEDVSASRGARVGFSPTGATLSWSWR